MPKRERPNFDDQYSIMVLFSNRFIEGYFKKLASRCPSLSKLDDEVFCKLQSNEIRRVEIGRKQLMPVLIGVAIVIYVIYLRVNSLESHNTYYRYASISVPFIAALANYVVVVPLRRRYYELFATRRLFMVSYFLEQNKAFWDDSNFRKIIAVRIDNTATAIEGIPFAYRGIAPQVHRELLATSRSKAQAMRRLELMVMRPEPSTYAELVERLVNDLKLLAKGQWYKLPDANYEVRLSRFFVLMYAGIAALFIGGIVAIIIFASKVGPAAPALTTILSIAALASLNKIGLSADIIEKYATAGAKIIPSSNQGGTPSKRDA